MHGLRRVREKFSSRRFERGNGCGTHFGLLIGKTFDSYFLDILYVEFVKNLHLADWNEVMAVRLILGSWGEKCLIAAFWK